MFHGNILTNTRSLNVDLDAFEDRNGSITKSIQKEFHSFKLMQERFEKVLAAAISFQKTHFGETF